MTMNFKYIILALNATLIVILNVNDLFSQSNFKAGYIIDIYNDTIKGFIDYQNWDITPKKIVFKSVSDSKVTIYAPNNIRSFRVAGERYLSRIVTIDDSPWRDIELTESGTPQYKTDTVFLQILIDGDKSLYYMKDKNLKIHFLIGKNGICETLLNLEYLKKNVNGTSYIQKNEKFKGQLHIYLQDCSEIQKKIVNVSYFSHDLIKLFNEYYNCTKKKILYQTELEKTKLEFGIFGGLSQTQLKFTGDDSYFSSLINTDYPWSKNFTFGVSVNFVFPRKQGKWSINNELMFTSYKVNGINLDSNNVNIYEKTYTSIGSSYIKLNTILLFKYPIKGMFIFIDGGISNGIALSETNYLRSENHVYSVNKIIEQEALFNARRWEEGIIMGIGSNFRNYSFEFRIERSNGTSRYTRLSSPVLRYFFILGYKF